MHPLSRTRWASRRSGSARRCVVVASALAAASCGAPTDAGGLRVLSAALTAPAPLVRVLHVELDRPAQVAVEYWTDGDPRLRVEVSAAPSASVALTRLRPSRSYRYEVVGTTASGTFTSDTLPADLAASLVSTTGRGTVPLLMLHLYDPNGFKGYAIADEHGDVVWYWRTADVTFGMTRRANGNFVLMDKGRGLVEVTPSSEVVHELAQDFANREMHHDVIVTPANTLFFIAFDDRVVNGATIRGDAIWEWSPETGALDKRWTSWDHFTLSDTHAPPAGEWMHANALSIGPRQNVLLSVHHWNQIISITSDWRSIEWRLGGANATLPLPASEAFSGQHTAREIEPGRVVLFDNGTDRGGYSRAVEYSVEAGSARTLWEWRSQPANFAAAVGSARRLADGHTVIAFGMKAGLAGSTGPTEIYEVDADGTPVRHLVTRTQTMYRAEPLTSVGQESVVP
jgi:hypothetical protein